MGSAAASFIHTYLQSTHSLAMEGSVHRKDTYVQITLTNIPLVHTTTSWTLSQANNSAWIYKLWGSYRNYLGKRNCAIKKFSGYLR